MSKKILKKILSDLDEIINTKPMEATKRSIKYKAVPKYKKASINHKNKK